MQENKKGESSRGEPLTWTWLWRWHEMTQTSWAAVRVRMMSRWQDQMRDCARYAHVDVSGSGQWCAHRAMSRNHWCCHWRLRHALSPSHRPFWIFHFWIFHFVSKFSTCCRAVSIHHHFPCSHFVHTFAPRKHVIWGVVFTPPVGYSRPRSAVNDPSVTK